MPLSKHLTSEYIRTMPDEPARGDALTNLMAEAASGDKAAADSLLPFVYEQLRRAAQLDLAKERKDQTLSATALVHEAYLKLVGPREVAWANRAHFYVAAAEAMRRIVLDHARARGRRGGTRIRIEEIRDVASIAGADSELILAVDEAIERLASEDPEAAAIVRLRFYAGLSVDEAAAATGISPRTAARLWTYARAVLYRELRSDSNLK